MAKNEREQSIIEQLEGKPDGYKSARKEESSTAQQEEQGTVKKTNRRNRGTVPFRFGSIIFLFIGLTIAMLACALFNGIFFSLSLFYFKFITYLVSFFLFNFILTSVNTRAKFHVYSNVMIFYVNLCIGLSAFFDCLWTFPGAFAFLGHGATFWQLIQFYMELYVSFWGWGHLVLFLVFLVIEFARCKKGALRMKF